MKIITTVGTSLITNAINPLRNKCDISPKEQEALNAHSTILQKDYKEKDSFIKEFNFLKQFLSSKINFNEKTSAEIKSLIAIRNQYKNTFLEIELIATDTILSALCSEILKDILEKNLNNIKVNFNKKNIIKDLQVANYKRYKKGLINLLNRLNEFTYDGEYFDNIILNITGGFKGVIPYMTLYGQINNIPLFYIFEFTSALIQIPQLPIALNQEIFDKYWKEFYKVSQDLIEKNQLSQLFLKDAENLLEIEDNLVSINALGKILWDKYKSKNLIFYTTENIYNEIQKQPNIQKILKDKFTTNYKDKTEMKNSHYVYDDGNNPNRIFYFEKDNNLYIYKTFENHDTYEKFINNVNINKPDFMNKATLHKI